MANLQNDQRLTVSRLVNQTYNGKISVKVVSVNPSHPRRIGVADATAWIRSLVPESFINRFPLGRSVTIKRFSVNDSQLTVKENSTVCRGTSITVPEEIVTECETRFAGPVHAIVPISTVQTSPSKTKLSVKGVVITNQPTRIVQVKGENTQVREIEIEDRSGRVYATLWRQASDATVVVGDEVTLKDVTTNYSTFRKQNALNVNHADSITVTVGADMPSTITIVGVLNEELEENLNVLCEMKNTDKELTLSLALLQDFLQLPPDALRSIDDLMTLIPIEATGRVEGLVITELI